MTFRQRLTSIVSYKGQFLLQIIDITFSERSFNASSKSNVFHSVRLIILIICQYTILLSTAVFIESMVSEFSQ